MNRNLYATIIYKITFKYYNKISENDFLVAKLSLKGFLEET
ncbi:hypothetical protein [Sutcliffiella deserti]|nr:hypothetical protein [Sutcliffiella deserti]